ncbi:hypothetical protein JIG36_06480 [Actinoplanes sp. LDG1-06]|uniref:Uncharacterized protein n=1 Tax=Paractinoplanes ovalisporus TaxID=2810368 RepID=A0ABS2A5U1_9ACTN|nr:hypothetical protein [Actinoplanes ovalisporus]MBM2615208.1 hypothetical protein [Actinoplanes ovalisporus]
MTLRLGEELRDAAELVPAYDLVDGAYGRARRHRARRRAAAVAAVMVLVALVVVAPMGWHRFEAEPATPSPTPPSLPERVSKPRPGIKTVEQAPPGRASVVFGSGDSQDLTVVGEGQDVYRRVPGSDSPYAGEQSILSPDGSRLAVPDGVVDLMTGVFTEYPPIAEKPDVVVPQAWSRDGRWLAAISHMAKPGEDGRRVPGRATLFLYDQIRDISRAVEVLDPTDLLDGYAVAFAENGWMAYQSGRTISVVRPEPTRNVVISHFDAPEGARLAGRGAWHPDSGRLNLLRQERCCDGDAYPSRWQLVAVHPHTGAGTPTRYRELPGLVAVRQIGWSPSNEPVLVTLSPVAGAEVAGFVTGTRTLVPDHGHTDQRRVESARLVILARDGRERTVLSAPSREMTSIDVADRVIAAGSSPAVAPARPADRGRWWVAGAALVALAGAGLVARRRRPPG